MDSAAPPKQIEHHLLTVAPADRVGVVRALTGGDNRSLVFTRTKHGAKKLARQLTDTGVPAAELHGNLSQSVRTRNLASFASGEVRVLVATDVLSEGQNLQDCAVVVNYDLPWAIIRLIQRAGRVDRIGQKSEKIYCHSFLPADGVERIIQLRRRIRQRLHENAEVVGSDESFFEDDMDEKPVLDLYNEKYNSRARPLYKYVTRSRGPG